MRTMIRSLALLLICASASFADEAATKQAKEAWEKYQAIQKEASATQQKAIAEYREALKAGTDAAEARKKLDEAMAKPRVAITEAQKAFAEAFAKTDLDAWDLKENATLVESGLSSAASAALKAGDLEKAGDAYGMLSTKFPEGRMAGYASMMSADLLAAQGKTEEARKLYEKLAESKTERTKSDAEQRLHLVGKVAPDIKSEVWIGGEAKQLSQLTGKVVVVDFWATWCPPCRAVMPAFSKLYAKHKDEGLVVMGLTRFYANGYMPANPEQMLTGGESVRNLTEKTFPEHVATFQKNTKMSYPFVIGEASNFKDYFVRGIPTVAVIGVDGKVALLAVGSGSEPLIEAVVKRELKKVKK